MALMRIHQRGSGKKPLRKPGHKERQAAHNEWLRSMGIDPNKKTKRKPQTLKLEPCVNKNVTSDAIPGNGSKKDSITYTGNEIAGVALMHKQNYEPVRKDNKQAAVASAQMRRN